MGSGGWYLTRGPEIALAGFLLLHGVAHLVGFAVPWRLVRSEEVPYKTTILSGTVDVGDVGIRILGATPGTVEAELGAADAILDGAQRAMGLWPTPALFQILADATVEGPSGRFRTLIHSSSDGRVRMEQTPQGFLAGVGRDGGWRMDSESGPVEDLGEALAFVRGHELHMLALLPRSRLVEARIPGGRDGEAGGLLAVAMSLPTGDSVVVYFEPADTLPAGLRVAFTEPHVLVTWSDWTEVRGVRAFRRAIFRQGDEAFHYAFDRVEPGPLPGSVFEPPAAHRAPED